MFSTSGDVLCIGRIPVNASAEIWYIEGSVQQEIFVHIGGERCVYSDYFSSKFKMVGSFPWQQQSSKFNEQRFDTSALMCDNFMLIKTGWYYT